MPNSRSSKSNPERSARHLIETLSGSEALPTFVRRIDPHTLKHLVDEVGIEDAGSLVAHATDRQIAHLLDETIWTGARPGDPDKLSVAELLRWLDLWNDLGAQFAADKLFELGDEFCALAFSRLLVVADSDMAPRILDEHTQIVGSYLVRTRVDDEWDTVQTTVNALWQDYPDFIEAIFGRLSFRHSILNMFGEDDAARVLDADAGHAHEQSREEGGYVTSILAGAFLRDVANAEVEQLAGETDYDLQTQEYFRRRTQLQQEAVASEVNDESAGEDGDARGTGESESGGQEIQDEPEAAPEEIRELELELAQYERAQHQNVALLTGPEKSQADESSWIRTALGELQSKPAVFDARMDELTYLANLLMSGAQVGDERLTSDVAANLAVATCNLGASHELWLDNTTEDAVDATVAMLNTAPGLVRLFRIGWCLLAQLPRQASECLSRVFQEETVRQDLAQKPWVLSEVDALLTSPSLEETVARRDFDDARETIKILSIALEAEAVAVLCVLTDGVPRFARALEDQPPEGAVVTYAARDFVTMADLLVVHRFLDGLQQQVRM